MLPDRESSWAYSESVLIEKTLKDVYIGLHDNFSFQSRQKIWSRALDVPVLLVWTNGKVTCGGTWDSMMIQTSEKYAYDKINVDATGW